MNYYEHHLGDYAAATAHLSWDEDMAYTRLLRAYYHAERGITQGQQYRIARATTPAQRKAVDAVLAEFFVLAGGTYTQKRAEQEVVRFQDKQRKARASANSRWEQTERNANASRTHSERNANASAEDDANALRTHAGSDADKASASRKDSEPYKTGRDSATDPNASNSLINNEREHANALRTQCEGNALQTPDTRHQTPEEKTNTRKPARKRAAAARLVSVDDLVSEGVDEQNAADWLAARKAKNLLLTATAWAGTKAEAEKAQMSPADAVREAATQGWAGFKAAWLTNGNGSRHVEPVSKQSALEARNAATVRQLLGQDHAEQ